MKKVLVLTRYDRKGASSRLRIYQYLDFFNSEGVAIDFTVFPLLNDQYIANLYAHKKKKWFFVFVGYFKRLFYLLCYRRQFDLIWIEKELFQYCPAWFELWLLGRKPFILDYDDAIFHHYDRHKSKLVRYLFGKKIDHLMKKANIVMVGNAYLGERARQAGAGSIELIPTVIDVNRYIIKENTVSHSQNPMPVIGWIGAPSTQKFLDIVLKPLSELAKIREFKLVVIGANDDFKPIGFNYEVWKWSETMEVEMLHGIDIGIMPLYDQPFEKGKCGYKLVQYMACGKPVVATPVGVNSDIVDHGVNGFLANSDEEWFNQLLVLLDDPLKRVAFGQAGRAKVVQQYSLQQVAPQISRLFFKLLSGAK